MRDTRINLCPWYRCGAHEILGTDGNGQLETKARKPCTCTEAPTYQPEDMGPVQFRHSAESRCVECGAGMEGRTLNTKHCLPCSLARRVETVRRSDRRKQGRVA